MFATRYETLAGRSGHRTEERPGGACLLHLSRRPKGRGVPMSDPTNRDRTSCADRATGIETGK